MMSARRSSKRPTHPVTNDDQLQSRVQRELAGTAAVNLYSVTVEAHEGVVTLGGRVSRYYDMQIVLAAAMRTEGVAKLDNQIRVTK